MNGFIEKYFVVSIQIIVMVTMVFMVRSLVPRQHNKERARLLTLGVWILLVLSVGTFTNLAGSVAISNWFHRPLDLLDVAHDRPEVQKAMRRLEVLVPLAMGIGVMLGSGGTVAIMLWMGG